MISPDSKTDMPYLKIVKYFRNSTKSLGKPSFFRLLILAIAKELFYICNVKKELNIHIYINNLKEQELWNL